MPNPDPNPNPNHNPKLVLLKYLQYHVIRITGIFGIIVRLLRARAIPPKLSLRGQYYSGMANSSMHTVLHYPNITALVGVYYNALVL